jgi:DNA-binding response OmpR family regulator
MQDSLTERSLLIVEDEFELRTTIATALHATGWRVQCSADGLEALTLLRRWRPDVVLLDLKLPVMDGWAFRAEADRQRMLQGVKLVITSARTDPHSELTTLRADAALAKPFDLDELESLLDELTDVRPDEPRDMVPDQSSVEAAAEYLRERLTRGDFEHVPAAALGQEYERLQNAAHVVRISLLDWDEYLKLRGEVGPLVTGDPDRVFLQREILSLRGLAEGIPSSGTEATDQSAT